MFTAEETRRFLKLLANRRAGVNVSGDLAVSQNGSPNMTVNIAAGEALVNGSETATQGAYYLYNDAVLNRTIAASDPTNPRNDLVCLRVRDQVYSGSNNDGDVVVVTGTPAGSPVDPAAPANSLTLARVVVTANATSIVNANITDLRTWQSDKLVPGLSGFVLRNAADSQSNLNVTDAGLTTLRNALLVPPSAGGTLPATAYGTLPVKLFEQYVTSGTVASFNPTSIASGYRDLDILWGAITDQGSGQQLLMQVNADTGGNYSWSSNLWLLANTAVTTSGTNSTSARVGTAGTLYAAGRFTLHNYAISLVGTYRQYTANWWQDSDTTGAQGTGAGEWKNSANALTSLLIFGAAGNLKAGSWLRIFGVP